MRQITGGDETIPTVVVGTRVMVNPSAGRRAAVPPPAACPASLERPAESRGEGMRVELSTEAADLVRQLGGRLWVWAAHPRVCCWSTPPYMHAASLQPAGMSGFQLVWQAGVEIWFRAPGGRFPDVLEVAVRGRRRPRVEAYWDGCPVAL